MTKQSDVKLTPCISHVKTILNKLQPTVLRPLDPRPCPVICIDSIWLATESMDMCTDTEIGLAHVTRISGKILNTVICMQLPIIRANNQHPNKLRIYTK